MERRVDALKAGASMGTAAGVLLWVASGVMLSHELRVALFVMSSLVFLLSPFVFFTRAIEPSYKGGLNFDRKFKLLTRAIFVYLGVLGFCLFILVAIGAYPFSL